MALDCAHNITGLAFIKTQEFFITYCITFVFLVLCVVPFRVEIIDILCKLQCSDIYTSIFMKILCIGNIILGLYQAAHECGHSQVPKPKLHKEKCEQDQQPLQSALPPKDEYLVETQTRQTLVIEDNSSPLTPLTIDEPEWKETLPTKKQLESTTDMILEGETPVSQVTPLLGTTPSENIQIQHWNMPENISDKLGVYKRYVDTPLQTLDGIIISQPKCFLPLAEEAKRIAKKIKIEKINKQWAGIPHEQLLNKSFNDQLNSIQILEQLAPLQLAKEHLPGNITNILERLGKADNIPFNQLYYIAKNCTDHYYSKVIKTFVTLLKCQFMDRQLLLVNTARSLKFLEDYMDCQGQICKIFQKHQMIPDDIQDLHFHIDDFKNKIEEEFAFLKEATHKNIENFQSSLSLQQTYSASLCSYVSNIYNKLVELQWQLPHPNSHMNTGDTIHIEVPDFDPDIDEVLPIPMDQDTNDPVTQGSEKHTLKSADKVIECRTPLHHSKILIPKKQTVLMLFQWRSQLNMTSNLSKTYSLNRHIRT